MLAFAHFYARRASRCHNYFGVVAVVPIPTDLRQGATDPHVWTVLGALTLYIGIPLCKRLSSPTTPREVISVLFGDPHLERLGTP